MLINSHFGYDHPGSVADFTFADRPYLVDLVHRYKFIRFRKQQLTPDQLVTFSELFGRLWTNDSEGILSGNGEFNKHHTDTNKITIVSNRSNGVLGSYEVPWHCDVSHKPWNTPGGTMPFRILYCVKKPENEVGTTKWFDQHYLYDNLDPGMRYTVDRLNVVMKAPYKTGWDSSVIPLVLRDPLNGRRGVCIQSTFFQHFEGMSREQSLQIAQQLFSIATREDNVITQQWEVGDLVFYSNITTVHHRDKLNSAEERVLWRTTFQIPELIPLSIKPEDLK